MVPMRTSRLLLSFPVLVATIMAIYAAADAIAPTARVSGVLSTTLTSLLIVSYAWTAPALLRFMARPQTESLEQRRRVEVMVRRLARSAGIQMPRLVVVEHASTVAYSVGLPGASTLFITTGLCAKVDGLTLKGVLAHEVSHIEQRHALFQSAVFAGVYACKILLGLPPILAPFVFLGYLAFTRRCEFAADAGACRLIGCERAQSSLRALADLMGEIRKPSVWVDILSTHPSYCRRVDALLPRAVHHASA